MRFVRANTEVCLRHVRLGEFQKLVIGTYFDGYWVTRPDGSSHGLEVKGRGKRGGEVRTVCRDPQYGGIRSADTTGDPSFGIPRTSLVFLVLLLTWEHKKVAIAVDALECSKLFFVGMSMSIVTLQIESIMGDAVKVQPMRRRCTTLLEHVCVAMAEDGKQKHCH